MAGEELLYDYGDRDRERVAVSLAKELSSLDCNVNDCKYMFLVGTDSICINFADNR